MKSRKFIFLFLLLSHFSFAQDIIDSSIVQLETIVYFESNEYILSDDDKSKIKSLLDSSANYSDFKFFVDAHTDDVGSEVFNLKLSEKRKNAIVEYLISEDIAPQSIISNFYGEAKRIALNDNDEDRRLNRRALIQLITSKQFLYLNGTVIDEDSKEGISAKIQIRGKDFKNQTETDSAGKFKILSPVNTIIAIEVEAKNYFIDSKFLKITDKHKDIKLKIPLPKVEIGKVFKFKNMLFRGNRSIILPRSYRALAQLKRFMIVNDEHCIEIAGHINHPNAKDVGRNSNYFDLSVSRALVVHDALLKGNIDSSRLLARGYGNWKMLYPKATNLDQEQLNRRVEIIITSCDSTNTIENDYILFKGRFNEAEPLNKNYSPSSFKEDIQTFPKEIKEEMNAQIKQLEKARIDPSKYTYLELFLAFPNFPQSKS